MFSFSFRPSPQITFRQKLISGTLFLIALVTSINSGQAQFSLNRVIISELATSGEIEIFNPSSSSVDISNYWVCNFPAYTRLSDLTLVSGTMQLAPGETVVVSNFSGFNSTSGELGLYASNDFGSSSEIRSYIEYGSSGNRRSSVAIAAGIWATGMSLPAPTATASIQAQGTPPSTLTYTNISPTIGTPDPSLLNSTVSGGAIALVSGATDTVICIDGVPSPFDVLRDGTSQGTNREFVITDDLGNILALPPNNGPFDLEGAGVGTCEIWYIAYENGLQNLATGSNLSDLMGTFDLSNAITVNRQAPDGGVVTLLGGATNYTGCAGDIVIDVEHTTAANSLDYFYIITDDNNNILAFANAASTSTLDLSGAPAGTCHIWGWSSSGLDNPMAGDNISTLGDDPCEDISDDFITVYRETPDGGTVALQGGATDTIVTAGNAIINVEHTTTGGFLEYFYIITDDNDDILAFANAANTSTLDLSGAPAGTCRIWGWSTDGLDDPNIGDDIVTLDDDFCEAISTNFVTVVRQGPTVSGGAIALVSGATDTVICIDGVPSPFNVLRDGTSQGTNREFVITDDLGNILALPPNNGPFDLEGAGVGTCEIWYIAYESGLQNLATGSNLSDLMGTFDLSNPITVNRQAPDGGVVTLLGGATNYAGCAGDIVIDVEHTTAANSLDYFYIITDDNDNILAFANAASTSTLDLSGAPAGTCHIWGWSSSGLDNPMAGDNISTLGDDPCEDISDDFITVYRETPDGGTVALQGGATDTIVTAGNAIVNVEHTTTGGFLEYFYIITDENDDILAFANAANTSTLDLSGAPAGTCHIWGWNTDGLDDPNIGDDIVTLDDDFCEAISTNFVTVVRQGSSVSGGAIALVSGATDTVICIDGVPSPFDVLRDGTSQGTNREFVITDDLGNILALPPNNGPFDLEGAGLGTCEIWYIAYENGLQNLAPGSNLSDLMGTFDLSNPITVNRQAPDGGVVTLLGGATNYTGCAGDIVIDVEHTTAASSLDYFYIITDDNDDILAFANAASTSTLDLSGAPAGTCHIWGWSSSGLDDPMAGDNISTLADDPCEDISEDFITVYRETPDGGTITLQSGATDTIVTAGNAIVNVEHTTTGGFLDYFYIITDDNDDILAFANAANTSTLDLSGAPAGTCHIWGWNSGGLDDPIAGDNISTLADDFCEAISADFINVVREDPNTGGGQDMTIALNEVGTNGWIEIINNTDATVDVSSYWVCNRPAYAVLSSLNIECGSMNLAPGDIVVVSGFTGLDVVDGELALYNTNSFGSSTAIVSYMEWGSSGHGRSSVAIAAGLWTTGRELPAPTATNSLQRAIELVNGESAFGLADPTFCDVNSGVSSVRSIEELQGVSVHPNPTADFILVTIDNSERQEMQVRLFNATGQLIDNRIMEGGQSSSQLDMSLLPSGTYSLQVISGNAATTRRVIKH